MYASQLEAMYADVAMTYMKANIAQHAQKDQLNGGLPPNVEEFLHRTYADMLANMHVQTMAKTQKEYEKHQEENENEDGMAIPNSDKTMYNASNTQTWHMAHPHLDEKCTPSDNDPVMECASVPDMRSSSQLSREYMDDMLTDEEGQKVYHTHIDIYNPYQVPTFESSSDDPHVGSVYDKINPMADSVYASIGGVNHDSGDLENVYAHLGFGLAQASKQSTVKSYETIRSELVLPLTQRKQCHDVPL